MKSYFKDKEHLFLIAALFAAGLLVFLGVRLLLVPSDFGKYGHYRASALEDNKKPAIVYAGRSACQDCHDEKAKELASGKHKGLGCEACHGPQAKHADDPSTPKPSLPETPKLCLNCHLENKAKPRGFPQINRAEHGGGNPCLQCHKPHHPDFS
jgi:hypothetical protein